MYIDAYGCLLLDANFSNLEMEDESVKYQGLNIMESFCLTMLKRLNTKEKAD